MDSITSASAEDNSNQVCETKEQVDCILSSPDLEKWNDPKINTYRYFATLFSFTIMGMNDGAYGVSLTYPHGSIRVCADSFPGIDSIREPPFSTPRIAN